MIIIKNILKIFKKKIIEEPGIYQQWIKREVNPFRYNIVEILDIKQSYVKYKFIGDSNTIHSSSIKWFIGEYRKYGYEEIMKELG